MPSNNDSGKSGHHPGVARDDENIGGFPGKESHGGDLEPPSSDQAGRRQTPESGRPPNN